MSDTVEQLLIVSARRVPRPPQTATKRARSRVLAEIAAARPVHSRRAAATNRRRPLWIAWVFAAAAISVALLGWISSRPTDPAQSASTRAVGTGFSRAAGPGFSVSAPLRGAQSVSLAAAASAVGGTLALPASSSADTAAMGKVFEAQTTDDSGATDTWVAVTYPANSIVVEYETPVPYSDPAATYQAYVDETPANLSGLASVGQVGGHPALILQENKGSTGSNPASVEFVLNGVKVAVIGYQSANTLLTVAQSIVQGGTE